MEYIALYVFVLPNNCLEAQLLFIIFSCVRKEDKSVHSYRPSVTADPAPRTSSALAAFADQPAAPRGDGSQICG